MLTPETAADLAQSAPWSEPIVAHILALESRVAALESLGKPNAVPAPPANPCPETPPVPETPDVPMVADPVEPAPPDTPITPAADGA
jgi:hypothetical protein